MVDEHAGPAGFEEFYRRYYPDVHRHVTRRHGPAEADDITQETMLRALARFHSLADGRPPWSWLTTVADHVAVDQSRRGRRTVSGDEVVARVAPTVGDESVRVALRIDVRPLLGQAMRRLSDLDRQVLAQHDVGGARIGEIAAGAGLSANAVRQRLFRARRNLARHYRQLGGQPYAVPVTPGPGLAPTLRPDSVIGRLVSSPADAGIPAWRAPSRAAALLATALTMTTSPTPSVRPEPPRPPQASRPVVQPPGGRGVPSAQVGLHRPHVTALPLVAGVLSEPAGEQPRRVEAETGTIETPLCGDNQTMAVEPVASANGGLAVFYGGTGCTQSFTTRTPYRVRSIRFSVGGRNGEICGHFEFDGAVIGRSESVCEGAATWLLVTVTSTAGAGAFTVDWVPESGQGTGVDAHLDYLDMIPAGYPAVRLPSQCSDGVDNDGDHSADGLDPSCRGAHDDQEASSGPCDDGIDNDHDGTTDFADDKGCGTWGDFGEQCEPGTDAAHVQYAVQCWADDPGQLPIERPT